MADEQGFPEQYKVDGKIYYGRVWDVLYEMESILVWPQLLALNVSSKVTVTAALQQYSQSSCGTS